MQATTGAEETCSLELWITLPYITVYWRNLNLADFRETLFTRMQSANFGGGGPSVPVKDNVNVNAAEYNGILVNHTLPIMLEKC